MNGPEFVGRSLRIRQVAAQIPCSGNRSRLCGRDHRPELLVAEICKPIRRLLRESLRTENEQSDRRLDSPTQNEKWLLARVSAAAPLTSDRPLANSRDEVRTKLRVDHDPHPMPVHVTAGTPLCDLSQ